jgi:hypothetical protein
MSDLLAPVRTALDEAQAGIDAVQAQADAAVAERDAAVARLRFSRPAVRVGAGITGNADPAAFEARLGATLGVRRTYWGGTAASLTAAAARVKADVAAGRLPIVSFKPPLSWADMAAGKGDGWLNSVAQNIAEAAAPGVAWVAIHHEPENDTNTDAARDSWTKMQWRAATLLQVPGIAFGACLMGYHSLPSSPARWQLEECIPGSAMKWLAFDPYQRTLNTPLDTYLDTLAAYCNPRSMAWGLTETGITADAFAQRPTWFADTVTGIADRGGSVFTYFNSNVNSVAPWLMEPGGPRETAFAEVLKASR